MARNLTASEQQRDAEIWRLRCTERHLSNWEIAERVGVSLRTVYRCLGRARREVLKGMTRDLESYQAQAILDLETIASEAWKAWEETKQARYLHVLLSTTDRLCKLHGLDQSHPQQHPTTTLNVGIVNTLDPAWVAQVTGRPLASPTPPEGTSLPNPLPNPSLASIAPAESASPPTPVENTPPPA